MSSANPHIAIANAMTVDDLQVIYENDDFLVINKPSGMLVHRGWGDDPVVAVDLVKEYTNLDVAHPIHRLDRGCSGPIVFALHREAARQFREIFDNRTVEKRYYVFTRGITPKSGVIDHPIPRRKGGPRVPAVSEFTRLATFERYSLVEVVPKTGRMHQVRRHMKHISHPLIGDSKYGKSEHTKLHRQRFRLTRMALHCWCLAFEAPGTNQHMRFIAPLPADLVEPFGRMELDLSGTVGGELRMELSSDAVYVPETVGRAFKDPTPAKPEISEALSAEPERTEPQPSEPQSMETPPTVAESTAAQVGVAQELPTALDSIEG